MSESPVKSYRDLLVWQKGIALVKSVYSISRRFPDDERFGLTMQLRRAAISVPSNIAEGNEAMQVVIELRKMLNALRRALQSKT